MRPLPRGWVIAELGEVAEVRLGRQRAPKNHAGTRMRPYLRAANVTWSGLNLADVKEMNFTESESKVYELELGDVLVAEASGSASEVGKPAIWRGELSGCCFQNTLLRVRSRGPLPEYLHFFLLAEAASGRLGDAARGVGIHHIGAARMSSWPTPIPPLGEQRRIVGMLEEQFSRLEAAEASLEGAATRLAVLSEQLDAEALSGWETRTLSSICPTFVDCLHRTPQYSPQGVPALRPRDVVGGKLRLETAARVGRSEFALQTSRRVPTGGDVVYSRELSLGWAVLVPEDTELCLSQGMVLFRPDDSMLPEFLAFVLNSYVGRRQAQAAATGSAHPHVNLRDIRAFEIPAPPLHEQRRIVMQLDQRVSAIDALREGIERAHRRSASLRRAVLDHAFRGELVPDDPSDERADALLERVRTESRARLAQPSRRRTANA